jgi:AcrR family transcriptional regulator
MDRAERRQKILNHARDVFARRGYHAAKIEDIVVAAGIARGTFYLYFKDKRGVFEEIVDRAFTQIGMAIVRVDPRDTGRTVADQVQENIRRIVRMLLEDRPTTKILLTDAVGADPAFDRKLRSFYGVVETLLAESLREGQALGIVASGDVRMFAYLILGALKELLYQVVRREAAYVEDEIVQGFYDFLGQGCLRIRDAEATAPPSGTSVRPSASPSGGKAARDGQRVAG